MKRLTQEERKRLFHTQQAARQAMLDRLTAAPLPGPETSAQARARKLLGTIVLATLIGGGLLAFQMVEFHVPTSLDAFLPRL